jgi:hypothetical protein
VGRKSGSRGSIRDPVGFSSRVTPGSSAIREIDATPTYIHGPTGSNPHIAAPATEDISRKRRPYAPADTDKKQNLCLTSRYGVSAGAAQPGLHSSSSRFRAWSTPSSIVIEQYASRESAFWIQTHESEQSVKRRRALRPRSALFVVSLCEGGPAPNDRQRNAQLCSFLVLICSAACQRRICR